MNLIAKDMQKGMIALLKRYQTELASRGVQPAMWPKARTLSEADTERLHAHALFLITQALEELFAHPQQIMEAHHKLGEVQMFLNLLGLYTTEALTEHLKQHTQHTRRS